MLSAIPLANAGLLLDSKILGPFAVAHCIVYIYLRYNIVVLYMQQNKRS